MGRIVLRFLKRAEKETGIPPAARILLEDRTADRRGDQREEARSRPITLLRMKRGIRTEKIRMAA